MTMETLKGQLTASIQERQAGLVFAVLKAATPNPLAFVGRLGAKIGSAAAPTMNTTVDEAEADNSNDLAITNNKARYQLGWCPLPPQRFQ